MIRTQIQLTEEQAAKLKRVAAERGVSMAEVVRNAVDEVLDADERRRRLARAVEVVKRAKFRSGLTDVSVNHDRYLAEDFAR